MLVHVLAEARGAVLASDVVVIGDACEEVVRPCRDIPAIGPLLALQRHIALFLVLLQLFEQNRHAMPRRVLERERDEDESDAQKAQLLPRDRVLFIEPLERRGVVEGESGFGEALADLGTERLGRLSFRGRELAPQQVWNSAVQVAEAAVDGQLEAAPGFGRFACRHAVGACDYNEEIGKSTRLNSS